MTETATRVHAIDENTHGLGFLRVVLLRSTGESMGLTVGS